MALLSRLKRVLDRGSVSVSVRPPNSVVLIDGGADAIVPDRMNGIVGFTTSCVAIGTRSEQDGSTEIRLVHGHRAADAHPTMIAFVGVIAAPNGRIFIRNSLSYVYASLQVRTPTVQLAVSVDDLSEPTKIEVRVFDLPSTRVDEPLERSSGPPNLDAQQRTSVGHLALEVDRYRQGNMSLEDFCVNVRRQFDTAGITDPDVNADFEVLWNKFDSESELRSNPVMPPGQASEPALQAALEDFYAWAVDLSGTDPVGESPSPEVVERIAAEILDRSQDDWIQMSEVAWVAASIGGARDEAEVMHMSVEAMRSLLDDGAVAIGDLRVIEGAPLVSPLNLPPTEFRPWGLTTEAAIERVLREWQALGHRPNLGDIAWLDRVE